MIEFFTKIYELISIAVNFIISGIQNLIMLLFIVPKSYAAVVEALLLLPPFITVPVFAVIALSLTITIINKWG